MWKGNYVIAIFLLLLPGFAYSARLEDQLMHKLDISFEVEENNTIRHILDFTFSKAVNESLNYTLRGNISDIRVYDVVGNFTFSVNKAGDTSVIDIPINGSLSTIEISYRTDNSIYNRQDVYFFFEKLSFSSPVQKIVASAKLPLGYSLYSDEYLPQ